MLRKGTQSCRLVLIIIAAAVLAGGSTVDAGASGFALIEQGVRGLGNAYAGGAAVAEDATTIFFNPAGLTRLEGQSIELGVHAINPSTKFNDSGSTLTPLLGVEVPLTGSDGGNAGDLTIVPNLYWAGQMNEKLFVGLGINVPFGLATEYDDDWKGRYHGVKSEVMTVNLNPTIAYKFTDKFSAGLGFNAQKLDGTFSNAIDYGTINALVGAGLPLSPQGADGFVSIEADDYGYGFNLGFLFEQAEGTRYGLSYRSEIEYDLEGDADFTSPNAYTDVLAGLSGLTDGPATANITLPQSASASVFHKLSDEWAMMGDVTWTGWSSIEELRIKFASGASDAVTTLDWNDTWRIASGLTYTPSEKWDYRFGMAYDESPIPNPAFRTVRVPGNDRWWLTLGTTYKINEAFALSGGYAHIFISNAGIHKTGVAAEEVTRGAIHGEYRASVDILSMQLSWNF
jgi:long-chain fatty acid transport protein